MYDIECDGNIRKTKQKDTHLGYSKPLNGLRHMDLKLMKKIIKCIFLNWKEGN